MCSLSTQQQELSPADMNAWSHGRRRAFFRQVQPSISVPPFAIQPIRVEFVDYADTNKDLIVRKKAREWVHRENQISGRRIGTQCTTQKLRSINRENPDGQDSRHSPHEHQKKDMKVMGHPLQSPSAERIDPFDTLPQVRRKVDHIIEFYHSTRTLRFHLLTLSIVLTQHPKDVSSTNDENVRRMRHPVIEPYSDKTVLGAMAQERVSFVLWLHATTLIRDGMMGNWNSEESLWYYKLALRVMREESERPIKDYSDSFICSFACFAICANFAGQYNAAEVHRDALIKALTLKGSGNLSKGIRRCRPWVQKAIIWAEVQVAAQFPAIPKLPYMPRLVLEAIPHAVISESKRLQAVTLSYLPPLCDSLTHIILQLHQLSLSQPEPPVSYAKWPYYQAVDFSVVQLFYCAEYALLKVLSAQQRRDRSSSPFSIMFAEACHLYLWVAVRGLAPEMRLCDLFVARLKRALTPVLADDDIKGTDTRAALPRFVLSEEPHLGGSEGACLQAQSAPTRVQFAIIWALFLGTLVSSVGSRPEYSWFNRQLLRQIFSKHHGLCKSNEDFRQVLKLFPYTEGFCGLGIIRLGLPF